MAFADSLTLWNDACVELSNKRPQQALDLLYQIQKPTSIIYFNIATVLLGEKRLQDAIQYFTKAIDRDNHFAVAYFQRGCAYFHSNRLEEAFDDFVNCQKKMIAQKPQNYTQLGLRYTLYVCEPLYNCGVVCSRQEKLTKAMEYLLEAQKAAPEPRHKVIKECLNEIDKRKQFDLDMPLIELPVAALFLPDKSKIANLKNNINYLGESEVLHNGEQKLAIPGKTTAAKSAPSSPLLPQRVAPASGGGGWLAPPVVARRPGRQGSHSDPSSRNPSPSPPPAGSGSSATRRPSPGRPALQPPGRAPPSADSITAGLRMLNTTPHRAPPPAIAVSSEDERNHSRKPDGVTAAARVGFPFRPAPGPPGPPPGSDQAPVLPPRAPLPRETLPSPGNKQRRKVRVRKSRDVTKQQAAAAQGQDGAGSASAPPPPTAVRTRTTPGGNKVMVTVRLTCQTVRDVTVAAGSSLLTLQGTAARTFDLKEDSFNLWRHDAGDDAYDVIQSEMDMQDVWRDVTDGSLSLWLFSKQ